MILLNSLGFTREEQDCAFKRLEVRGLQSAEDNMTMFLEGDTIVVAPNEDENAGQQCMFIGSKFGILQGTVVKAQVLFLDGAMFVNVTSGVIDTETIMFSETGEMENWLLESNLDRNDELALEALDELDEGQNYPTHWVTRDDLFSYLNASTQNDYFTYETMFEVEMTYKKNGLFACNPTARHDFSNGKVAEMKEEMKKQAELKKQQAEQRKLDRQREHEKRMQEREDRENEKLMEKNKGMQELFANLISK